MRNPWLAKNPLLSMWLSATNSAFGAARSHAMNEARRQYRSMMTERARAVMAFWSGTPLSPPVRKKRRKR